MIKDAVDWVMIKLHFRKKPAQSNPMISLMGMLPVVVATAVLAGIVDSLDLRTPWYRKLFYKTRLSISMFRAVVVGY